MIFIENLSYKYPMSNDYIIKDLNLDIEKGDCLSITGPNGSGKSTLLKLLLGFLTPSQGKIKIDSKKISYVSQNLDNVNLSFPLSVSELLNCHRKVLKIKNKNAVETSMHSLDLCSLRNELVGTLSGGERQRLFLCRALMGDPDIIFLDEPSVGMDFDSLKKAKRILQHGNLEKELTIVIVEHNMSFINEMSNKILKFEEDSYDLILNKNSKKVLYV